MVAPVGRGWEGGGRAQAVVVGKAGRVNGVQGEEMEVMRTEMGYGKGEEREERERSMCVC